MFKFRSMKMNAPDVRNADGTTLILKRYSVNQDPLDLRK